MKKRKPSTDFSTYGNSSADFSPQDERTEVHATWLARRGWSYTRLAIVAYLFVLLAMMFLETWLVYPAPPTRLGDWNPTNLNHEDVWFESADGTKLHGWYIPHPEPKRAILYCHGNGEHIACNAALAAQMRDSLSASILMFDYRGYGQSEGRPHEAGCIADGRAAQRWLAAREGIRPCDVVLMGRSLGGGVAVALACEEGAGALIVENTFPSIVDVAAHHLPWLPVRRLMKNRYDSLSRIQSYQGPFVQTHGMEDRLVPIELARRLFQSAADSNKKWIEYPGLDHNDAWPTPYYTELARYLDALN